MMQEFIEIEDLRAEYEEFLASHIRDWEDLVKRCGIKVNKKCFRKPIEEAWEDIKAFTGGIRCKQYPRELGQYLKFVCDNSSEITSYLEIGVENGGTFFMVDSLLRSIHEDDGVSVRSTGVDIRAFSHRPNFKAYSQLHPSVTFTAGDSKKLDYDFHDLCFIDGDHSYHGVKADYSNLVDKCKFLVLHDIGLPQAGVSKLWAEIKNKHSHHIEIFNDDPLFEVPVGIGIIKV